MKTDGGFPKERGQDQGRSDAVGRSGKGVLFAGARGKYQPRSGINDRHGHDQKAGNGTGFGESAQQERAGEAEDASSSGGDGVGGGQRQIAAEKGGQVLRGRGALDHSVFQGVDASRQLMQFFPEMIEV